MPSGLVAYAGRNRRVGGEWVERGGGGKGGVRGAGCSRESHQTSGLPDQRSWLQFSFSQLLFAQLVCRCCSSKHVLASHRCLHFLLYRREVSAKSIEDMLASVCICILTFLVFPFVCQSCFPITVVSPCPVKASLPRGPELPGVNLHVPSMRPWKAFWVGLGRAPHVLKANVFLSSTVAELYKGFLTVIIWGMA